MGGFDSYCPIPCLGTLSLHQVRETLWHQILLYFNFFFFSLSLSKTWFCWILVGWSNKVRYDTHLRSLGLCPMSIYTPVFKVGPWLPSGSWITGVTGLLDTLFQSRVDSYFYSRVIFLLNCPPFQTNYTLTHDSLYLLRHIEGGYQNIHGSTTLRCTHQESTSSKTRGPLYTFYSPP